MDTFDKQIDAILQAQRITGAAALIKFDADDSAPTYIGLNTDPNASDGDKNWQIIKFTYSGSNVTQIKIKYGSWTARATLLP